MVEETSPRNHDLVSWQWSACKYHRYLSVPQRSDTAVFSQYYEKANPGAAAASAGGAHEIAQALEEEVAELKQGESDLFKYHNTNIGGLAYVSMAQDAGAPPAFICAREGSRKPYIVHVGRVVFGRYAGESVMRTAWRLCLIFLTVHPLWSERACTCARACPAKQALVHDVCQEYPHTRLACLIRALGLAAPPGPVELVVAIARDVKATKQNKTRRAIHKEVTCPIATWAGACHERA